VFRVPTWLVGALLIVALTATACGSDDPVPRSQPSPTPEPTETTLETPVESPTAEPEPRFTAEVTIVAGKIDGPKTVEVEAGEEVSIAVTSDVADHVHVHGYDKLVDLVPGKRAVLRFTANIPGVWEVELEDAHELLFELKVQ
jgi:heme/copper-type cytochrome/quinol oxidase subunit 2